VVHDFHLSKCIAKYSESDSTLQVSIHIFLDDFEKVLSKDLDENLFLCTDKENSEAEEIVSIYLEKTVQFYLNGEKLPMNYLGKEISNDLAAVWCYLEVPISRCSGTLEMSNTILLETFDDQRNITSIQLSENNKEHFMFERGAETGSISF